MLKSLFILIIAAAANSEASTPLEYRFNVGEELIYELVGKEDLLEKQEESDRRLCDRTKRVVHCCGVETHGCFRRFGETRGGGRHNRGPQREGKPYVAPATPSWGEATSCR